MRVSHNEKRMVRMRRRRIAGGRPQQGEQSMHDFNHDPRFSGIEQFQSKIWNGVYYWGNQEEKPWFTRVFKRLSPILKLQFSISDSRFENLERLRWLLGYSWIDPQCRVENSIKEVWLSPHVSFWERWAICCVWESLCPRIQYSMNLDNIQVYKTNINRHA